MKMSKIFAGVSALAMAATMAVSASAADTAYLYTVQASWSGCPADEVEGQVKFTENVKKGACDLNQWDSGSSKFNGQWAQYVFTSDDMSNVTIEFTIESTASTQWEYHEDGDQEKDPEGWDSYQLFLTLGKTELVKHADVNGSLADPTEGVMTSGYENSWTYTYTGDDITAAIENNKAQLAENGDGTYTLGFNIQVGHVANVLVTGTVTADNLYTGAADATSSSTADTDTSSNSKADASSTASSSSSAASSSSKSGSTNNNGTKNNAATSTAAASSTASDNTNAGTGATAGIALAGIALAGAALVVAKKK